MLLKQQKEPYLQNQTKVSKQESSSFRFVGKKGMKKAWLDSGVIALRSMTYFSLKTSRLS
jgi:hypothetical protein